MLLRILVLKRIVESNSGLFSLVAEMMFGFGDKIEPYPGSVEVMDELVKDFITNLVVPFFRIVP